MIDGYKLTREYVQLVESFGSWEEAIRYSARPLLENGDIEARYVEAMITSVNEHGPYVVIAPNIAMPHARPEAGGKRIAYSVMKVENPVYFTENHDPMFAAKLFITLSCVDDISHVKMLQAIATVLSDEAKLNVILQAKEIETILEALK